MKIAILGRKKYTANYETYLKLLPATPITTLTPSELSGCHALILPGGGDITPAFFGENNTESKDIDTELDILQFQALEYAIRHGMPILGICKGMQLINVAFGGTITQNLSTSDMHRYVQGDQYHSTIILEGSCLYELYGKSLQVNSAHHQGIKTLGKNLQAIQWCPEDGCIEGIVHDFLPILGLQWHPERLIHTASSLDGKTILRLLSAWIHASQFPLPAGYRL
ncbi:MAG: gamma-glutamyl-gamma-aminobutyrate hydrolase family protein [Acetatifactor sp.]|nr:gamma-glutamyl-gamma-aminobutyrate hydrolase family protein [Acetatifactor sp.]